MPGTYLVRSRRSSIFYFRRRVPDDLRPIVGKVFIQQTLHTSDRREAIILARALAAKTDTIFRDLRTMKKQRPAQQTTPATGSHFDYIMEIDLSDSGRPKSIKVQAEPHEQEAVNSAIATALQNQPGAPAEDDTHAEPKSKGGITIMQAWEGLKAEKVAGGKWKDGNDTAKYDYLPHIRAMVESIGGDKPIADVTADEIIAFQTLVTSDRKGGSPRNREKRLQRAGAVFRWAKTKRHIPDPFAELFKYEGKIEENFYAKFEAADLKTLFESNLYRNHEYKTPWQYWLPVLALHTGARLNELCQLTTTDIGEHDGVPTISILDEEEGKRLKTTASRRIIPIHSKLIELGFLDFVAGCPAGRLFPDLPESNNRAGDYSKEPGRWFTAYRRSVGVGSDKGRSNKTFHSFRGTLISALRKANVPKDRRTRLAGHEYDDTQDRHYTGGDALTMFEFKTLQADIESAKFDVEIEKYAG